MTNNSKIIQFQPISNRKI